MKLNWVTLRVSDLETSLHFYTQLLSLQVAARFGSPDHQIAMLGSADEAKVELIHEPNAQFEHPGEGVSFGLEADDLDLLVGTLREKGYEVRGPIAPTPHIRFFFVKDPDGYSVQLVSQKTT